VLERLIVKVLVDFTGVIQFRGAGEMGACYFAFNMVRASESRLAACASERASLALLLARASERASLALLLARASESRLAACASERASESRLVACSRPPLTRSCARADHGARCLVRCHPRLLRESR
jgi:hypothetical protein